MAKIEIRSKTLLLLILAIAVIIVLYVFRGDLTGKSGDTLISSKKYHAVFLSNSQVYFGILKNPNNQYLELTDIYYLQVENQNLQPEDKENKETKIELVKLGNELHGPKDKMSINRDQVLFIEELKDDGQVVKTIIEEKKKSQ